MAVRFNGYDLNECNHYLPGEKFSLTSGKLFASLQLFIADSGKSIKVTGYSKLGNVGMRIGDVAVDHLDIYQKIDSV